MSKVDRPTQPAAVPAQASELRRWLTLQESAVLDTEPEAVYDDLTALAATICGTPISLISLVDADRQWFKSNRGLGIRETPRALAFCAHAINTPEQVMQVEDARQDPRFATNPLVTDDPSIRFYAGAPILSREGLALGTLCVIDRKPGQLTEAQHQALLALARVASQLLDNRRKIQAMQLDTARCKALFEQPLLGVVMCTLDGEITEVNQRYCELTGRHKTEVLGVTLWKHGLTENLASQHAEFRRLIALGQPFRMEQSIVRPNGSLGLLGSELSLVSDEQGRPVAAIAVIEDLRERSLLGAHYLASADRFTHLKPSSR